MGPKSKGMCPFKKRREGRHRGGRPRADGGRGGSDAATAREHLVPPDTEEATEDSPLVPPEGAPPHGHLDFGPLASRAGREDIPAVLSHQVYGTHS